MKKQYFGDKRDLFKFDLIKHIVKDTGVGRFTYIPMLTPNDRTGDGKLRNNLSSFKNIGHKNVRLIEFFRPIHNISPDERDVGTIAKYFKSIAIRVQVYMKDKYLNINNRSHYFKGIEESLLQNALIFVDPDIGLEPVKANEKHLLYSEVKFLYDNMGEHSILTMIQFRQRGDGRKHKICEDIDKRIIRLYEHTKDMCIFISDYNITFFCLSKNFETKRRLSRAILSYKKDYENLYCGGIIL